MKQQSAKLLLKKTQKSKTEKHCVQYLKQNTTDPLEPKTDREHTFNVMMFHYVAKQPLQTTWQLKQKVQSNAEENASLYSGKAYE